MRKMVLMCRQAAASWAVLILLILQAAVQPSACLFAATIVLANRTQTPVEFDLLNPPAPQQHLRVAAGEVAALRVVGASTLQLRGGKEEAYRIDPNSAHFFHRGNGVLELEGIGLAVAEDPVESNHSSTTGSAGTGTVSAPRREPIKI